MLSKIVIPSNKGITIPIAGKPMNKVTEASQKKMTTNKKKEPTARF
jgi:hypothetical protein